MQKIVLEDGRIINIDLKNNEDEWFKTLQKATMIDDSTGLKEIYLYEFLAPNYNGKITDLEFDSYFYSYEQLSNEQIIHQMVKRNLLRYSVVIPHKAFILIDLDND